jgi:hypothetical protein
MATTWLREVACSLARMSETCTVAVFAQMNHSVARRLLLLPRQSNERTSLSRAVSSAIPSRPSVRAVGAPRSMW